MNNITKTGIGILTAGAIAGGTLLVTNLTDNQSTTAPTEQIVEIDWSQYDLNLPTLDIPTLDLISLDEPTLNDTVVVTFKIPTIDKNDIEIENINNILNGVDMAIKENEQQLSSMIKFQQLLAEQFKVKDVRSFKHDKSITYDNKSFAKWIDIYKQYENVTAIKFVKAPKFRMISEIVYPTGRYQLDILSKNLEFYKSVGYDSVLLTFDGTENVTNLVNLVKYIKKNYQLGVWFTYSGEESLNHSIFIDPDLYKEYLQQLAVVCDGYINSWRRTSGHLLEQDEAFKNYTNAMLREANNKLPIIGELYFGETHKYTGINRGYSLNSSVNNSAIMAVNFGYFNVNIDYVVKNILKNKAGEGDYVGLVVGRSPYYKTNNKQDDYLIYLDEKRQIEDCFIKAGCIGTITLQNDGKEYTNNLSEYLYNK